MSENYFMIYQDSKEATVLRFETKKDLSDFIKDYANFEELGEEPNFIDLNTLNKDSDPCYWGGYLIIKGNLIIPKAKKVVQEWEF